MNIDGIESRAQARFLSCALAQDDEIGSHALTFADELSQELLRSPPHERAMLAFRLEALLKSLEAYDSRFPDKLANPANARCRRFLARVIGALGRRDETPRSSDGRRPSPGGLALAV
ncbi:hypothetical protein [Hansschlegelia sp.]|uniref:hypothetical protein n=1 Tax=Hansschlegelia sp. TaxID=2041892 RepID=UPI002CEA3876|nr:hypothetical protein [Hansschlegelia sp.]HVI28090.1 hypothetical protein [Hansschlegelia sp.]